MSRLKDLWGEYQYRWWRHLVRDNVHPVPAKGPTILGFLKWLIWRDL